MTLVGPVGVNVTQGRREFIGMPPGGRAFSAPGIDIIRVADGKLVEHWGAIDTLSMMQQLGAVPEGAPAAGSA